MDISNINQVILASQGSQGVSVLRELFALGVNPKKITVLTFISQFNNPFIEFLKFNKMDFTIIKKKEDLNEFFKNQYPDILLSFSFRFKFSEFHLSKISAASINFHPGILPGYKGSFSIPWALINNEKYIGYTYHFMTKETDGGNIIEQEKIKIRDFDTAHSLNYLVFQKGISKLGQVIDKIGQTSGLKQNGKSQFYENKLPFEGIINNEWDKEFIKRFIKAMYFPPFDPAKVYINGKEYKVEKFNDYEKLIKFSK